MPHRDKYVRPVVKIKFRGRWRKVKSRAPKISELNLMYAGVGC